MKGSKEMSKTIDTEKMKRGLFDAVVQLDSYNTILSSYMELHENILEMTHASLLVDKMQEQIDTMKEFFDNY